MCNVCIHLLVYNHTVLKLVLACNLNVKWSERGWYFWNEMFWHYRNETRKMKWLILTLSCGKLLQNWSVPVEQLDFNKTAFLEWNSVLLKHFWAAVGETYLKVYTFGNLPFSEMKATRHVKSTIHFVKSTIHFGTGHATSSEARVTLWQGQTIAWNILICALH